MVKYRFSSSNMDFPSPLMNNSALMQSYNLMKMSSEVTKTQNTPQFVAQDKMNDFYPKQQMDFNRNIYPPQRSPGLEKQISDSFLGEFIDFSDPELIWNSWHQTVRNGNTSWNGSSKQQFSENEVRRFD
jgi:hypothetical protein